MLNLGAPELLVILVVGLVVLGPTRLPQAARQVGHALGELRRVSAGFSAELQHALTEPPEAAEATRAVRPRRLEPLRAPAAGAADEEGS